MKRIVLSTMICLFATLSLLATNEKTQRNDTLKYLEISGKVLNAETEEAIVFATVFVRETSIATVTNTDGEFIIKIPFTKENGQLAITHLGFENKILNIQDMVNKENLISLKIKNLPIDEVVVRSIDPKSLLLAALDKTSDNYSGDPEMQTGFYRETIQQKKKYVSVSEAVLDVYKAPYRTTFDFDRMKIYKGRKSRDVKKMDTVLVKLQGGPRTSLLLDVVKNPGDILSHESFEYYTYKLAGITSIDDRDTYVIEFDQIDNLMYPLYKGKIYIDVTTNAFAGLDFGLSDKGIPYASKYLVKKKPVNMDIEVLKAHYLVRYRLDKDDNWYLNYVRSELDFDSKWDKKLFKTDIHIMLEMAVTDREKENLIKFTGKEMAKLTDVFAEQVSYFEDENFWGDYNTIKPDESIEIAIEKLNKKLKRRQ
ncbi:MAG: carboxypeptidase-like regulatory domain-containing protein [Bacteroidales bacterium]|nr:carboxypeptidase-like regulatory domain-containing protein [Bacteroidales bacterium]MBN2821098.1 carboxypeptidase-like regulatory domain-containing protein [Bacteroidales bacterium]